MLLIPESPLHPFNGVHGILFVLCKYCVLSACRQTIFLPVVGLVDADTMKPGDLVGVNKDSYLILDTLPSEYDSRVKAMEVQHANKCYKYVAAMYLAQQQKALMHIEGMWL